MNRELVLESRTTTSARGQLIACANTEVRWTDPLDIRRGGLAAPIGHSQAGLEPRYCLRSRREVGVEDVEADTDYDQTSRDFQTPAEQVPESRAR